MKVKKRLLGWILIAAVTVAMVCIGYLEFEHHYNYGHLFGYGVHVDAASRYSYIGIPGQTHMYYARVSNFTFLPVSFAACDYVTDAMGRGTDYPYSVQRWDKTSNEWTTIVMVKATEYCNPTPLSTIETNMTSKWILPGMTEDVSDGEATGARVPFEQGDLARFVVFRKLGTEDDWRYAIPSEPFVIADRVIRDDNSSKIAH